MENSEGNSKNIESDHKMKIVQTDDNNNTELTFLKRIVVGSILVILFISIALTIFVFIHEFIFVRLFHIGLPFLEMLDLIILIPGFILIMLGGFTIAKKIY